MLAIHTFLSSSPFIHGRDPLEFFLPFHSLVNQKQDEDTKDVDYGACNRQAPLPSLPLRVSNSSKYFESQRKPYPSRAHRIKIHHVRKVSLDLLCQRRACPSPQILAVLARSIRNRHANPDSDVTDFVRDTELVLNGTYFVRGLNRYQIRNRDSDAENSCDHCNGEEKDRGPELSLFCPRTSAASLDVMGCGVGEERNAFLDCSWDGYCCCCKAGDQPQHTDSDFTSLWRLVIILQGVQG